MILWNAMEPKILSMVHIYLKPQRRCVISSRPPTRKTSIAHANIVYQAYAWCEQGDLSLTEYFSSIKKLSDKMRHLFPCFPDCATYERLCDHLDTLTFLACMSSKYSTAWPIHLGQSVVATLATTYHLLSDMFPFEGSVPTHQSENWALVAGSYKGKCT